MEIRTAGISVVWKMARGADIHEEARAQPKTDRRVAVLAPI
jgi:hypothetical protein